MFSSAEEVKLPTHRAGLPGNVDMITGSALTPLRESVAALPAYKAGIQPTYPWRRSSFHKEKGKRLWNGTDTRNK
jgi:hypothetical protein